MVTSGIVASQVNETGEMGGEKSFKLELGMTTASDFVSPVIDLGSLGANTVMNRINSVSSLTDLASDRAADLIDGTQPEGDNNAAIYCTRLVQLENPASQLKVIFDGFKPAGTASGEIKTYYKLLKSDSTLPIEELGWTEFGTTNVPDADSSKFRSYEYAAENLDEFVGFEVSWRLNLMSWLHVLMFRKSWPVLLQISLIGRPSNLQPFCTKVHQSAPGCHPFGCAHPRSST